MPSGIKEWILHRLLGDLISEGDYNEYKEVDYSKKPARLILTWGPENPRTAMEIKRAIIMDLLPIGPILKLEAERTHRMILFTM